MFNKFEYLLDVCICIIIVACIITLIFGACLLSNNIKYIDFVETKCTLLHATHSPLCTYNNKVCYNTTYYVDLIDDKVYHFLIAGSENDTLLNHEYDCVYKNYSILLPGENKFVNIHKITEGYTCGAVLIIFACSIFYIIACFTNARIRRNVRNSG